MKARGNSLFLRFRDKIFPSVVLRLQTEDGIIPFCKGDLVAQEIYMKGSYEQGDREFLRQLLPNFHCFVDVGANLGIYTLLAARHIAKGGQVFAFEASCIEFNKLSQTLAWNNLCSVTAENLAVGDTNSAVQVFESLIGSGALNRIGMKAKPTHSYREITVSCVSLDDFFNGQPQQPDFLKVDVEGFELKVLQGAKNILTISRPMVMVEMVLATSPDGLNLELVFDFMEDLDYRLFSGIDVTDIKNGKVWSPILKEGIRQRTREAKISGTYSSRNMYCIPLEKINEIKKMIA